MNSHISEIRECVRQKETALKQLEQEQNESWRTWDQAQRELSQIQINRERIQLNELRAELNKTLVAYNESKIVQQALPFGKRVFSTERAEELQRRLAIPLSHDDVSTRQAPGRQDVVYIETFKALEKAQEVFGFDVSIEVRSEPTVLFQQNGKVVMKSIVRVTLANGCYHEDVGIGASMMNDPVEAVKMATKACVSDSIKRTLQHFGPALGSCLRDKEWVSTDLAPAVMANRGGGKTTKHGGGEDQQKRARYGNSHHQNEPMSHRPPPTVAGPSASSGSSGANSRSYVTSTASSSGTVPAFNPPVPPAASTSLTSNAQALSLQQQATLALLEPPSFEARPGSSRQPDHHLPGALQNPIQQQQQNIPANAPQVQQNAGKAAVSSGGENEDDLARAYDEAMRAFCESASTMG